MLLDGNVIASAIEAEIEIEIRATRGLAPGLAVILVGENPASQIYVARKNKACKRVGIDSIILQYSDNISHKDLLREVKRLNDDPKINGILIQLPLPPQIDTQQIMFAIDPNKDVDGFHPVNAGKLVLGDPSGFVPCTPLGIKTLLNRYQIKISGKRVVILGRSNIVGKPLALLLMQKDPSANASVTIAHSQSEGLQSICKEADILIAAIGQAKYVKADMVKKGAVVVDVGITRLPGLNGKNELVGDVDFAEVSKQCSAITPVPGGVGPMTIAMLLSNTLKAFKAICA